MQSWPRLFERGFAGLSACYYAACAERGPRDEFIEGFISVFAEEGLRDKGRRYAKIISGALAGDVYELVYEYGTKHVNDQITDAQVQVLIRRSLGMSGSVTLG